MKLPLIRFLWLVLGFTYLSHTSGQNVSLTLQVDMSQQTISSQGIHVAGNFQSEAGFGNDWDPAATPMTDPDGDQIYHITLQIPSGTYEYKFINGNAWGSDESPPAACSVSSNNNRFVIVPNSDLVLPPVGFNACLPYDPSISTNYQTYWWNDAVFYEIFVRSFYDSDNDGIGDFRGIIEKLDYLNDGDPNTDTDLGITGIWLMPMMESPSYHGYDVTDYFATEPDYGTMADFEALLEAAHARGIKVIIDFVMNHTSDQHPWFTQSANAESDFRDWYIWSDNNPGFNGPWGQNVWHSRNNDYYYGLFWGGMPDLNYSHPPVKEAMFEITEFWLDKGVDGFRLDAIKYLDEDGTVLENTPETFTLLEDFNTVYKTANPEAFTVGEVWSNTTSIIPFVQNDRLDICFDFDLAGAIINAVNGNNPATIQNQFNVLQLAYPKLQYATFLTNHDIDRVFSQLGNSEARMKLAASLYLSMPGIPFIYYGEELGMTGTGNHENIRRPMQWSAGANGGFSNQSPWYGLGSNYPTNNVASMGNEPTSLLQHYKKLVHIRNDQAALRRGYLLGLETSTNGILPYARIYEDQAVLVVSNFSTVAANPSISLTTSSLPAGTYAVRELYSNTEMGTIHIDEEGGFSEWAAFAGANLGYRETWLLGLNPEVTTPVREQVAPELDFSLTPNPASEQLQLQVDVATTAGQIRIVDTAGKCHYEASISGTSHRISTHDWPAGLYFVKVISNGRFMTKPLLIQ